jgi:hypothetical protein
LIEELLVEDLLYKKGAIPAEGKAITGKSESKLKLRWIHLPTNNVCQSFAFTLRSALTHADDLGTGILEVIDMIK